MILINYIEGFIKNETKMTQLHKIKYHLNRLQCSVVKQKKYFHRKEIIYKLHCKYFDRLTVNIFDAFMVNNLFIQISILELNVKITGNYQFFFK